MEKQVKISVIMPVYKVEKYVRKAIESILAQTLKEFEFLIVDDGSPDYSGKICDKYAQKDNRIQVFHKENGGAPAARNMAIDLAEGKYLYFLDSDDWVEPTMLEEMYNMAEKNQSQLVISGFYIDTYYDDNRFITADYIPQEAVYLEKEEFRREAYKLFDKNMLYPPWNKLYLKQYIIDNKIYFPQTIWDDFPFNLSVIRDINKVSVTKKQYYHFLRARTESETAKYFPFMYEKREEEHQWMVELYQYWNVSDPDSLEMISRRYIERLIGCFENLTNPNCTLETAEKKEKIKCMLSKDTVTECAKRAKGKTFYSRVMYLPIKWKWGWLTYIEAAVITNIKIRNVKVFSKLKTGR